MKHSYSHVIRLLISTLVCIAFTVYTPVAQAQFLTHDLPNFIQNSVSAISDTTSAYQQIEAVIMQTKQLANQIKNLQKLRISNWQEFVSALNQVNDAIKRTKFVARMWMYQAQNFDRLWGKYGPPVLEDGPLKELKLEWTKLTNDAYQHNMQVQADTANSNEANAKQLQSLETESEAVEGQLEATQLNTKTLTVVGSQQATMIDLELARANAEQVEKLEQRRKAEAARTQQREAIGGGFDELEPPEPVELPEFPGFY